MAEPAARIYLIPGMFGFGTLAGFDYFVHMRRELTERYRARGEDVVIEVVPTPPTSSIRYRAAMLAEQVSAHATDGLPIHLIGHSTGGLDARLVLSPTTNLPVRDEQLEWTKRVQSLVTLNTPHYGTPLAGYFATVSGTRVLYALSLFTVVSLSLGEPSLAIFSKLLAALGGVDAFIGGDSRLIGRATDMVLRYVDTGGRGEIREFLSKVRHDQGGVIQLMPEALDLFNAATEDNDDVRYGCVAAAAPPPVSLRVARRVRSPYAALTAGVYTTLYTFASQAHKRYPYAVPSAAEKQRIREGVRTEVDDRSNDGVVPTLSMLWGKLLWVGEGDHLDMLGHFHDDRPGSLHTDWMTSGAHFGPERFAEILDEIVAFQHA
ncbi:MAG: hypothetical protein R3B89_13875 [Polyangiaceae bacterium]